jgi:hypothetical protein
MGSSQPYLAAFNTSMIEAAMLPFCISLLRPDWRLRFMHRQQSA